MKSNSIEEILHGDMIYDYDVFFFKIQEIQDLFFEVYIF